MAETSPSSGHNAPKPSAAKDIWFHQFTWILLIALLIYSWTGIRNEPEKKLAYSAFKTELVKDNIARLTLRGEKLTGTLRIAKTYDDSSGTYKHFYTVLPNIDDKQLMPLIEQNQIEFDAQSSKPSFWTNLLISILPWALLIGFFAYTTKVFRNSMSDGSKGGLFNFAKSKARHFNADNIKQRFNEVAGLENAKKDLQEIIDFLQRPEKYRKLGAKIPKGILMMGPPGCGKTLLAKATAGEAGVPFFSVTGSEFIEMYVGVGASRVRDMFQSARKEAPALIFIDEIDSIGRVRGTGLGGGHDEREQTLNQILAEMDGFSTEEAVVVIAATNRPDILDPALLRPGRFDRKLVLELPQHQARWDILKVHTANKPLANDVNLERIAASTVGFSGADLANLVNEAALRAARLEQEQITQADFDNARDKVALGDESGELLTGDEKQRVAYHESGHAMLALLLPFVDPLNKISIIPRGRALGVTEQTPEKDRHNFTRCYLESRLCILLGGRSAEQLVFNEVSSGASDDLKHATDLARRMVTELGMSETLGVMNLQQEETHPFLGREIATGRKFSEHYAKKVDDEVAQLLQNCEQRALQLLTDHRQQLEILATALQEKETLDREQIHSLLPTLQNASA